MSRKVINERIKRVASELSAEAKEGSRARRKLYGSCDYMPPPCAPGPLRMIAYDDMRPAS